ncbi:hypothetical protein [Halorubrum aquaticum]|uniref:hypothetical protein n=1 Tax=Halorubrum aquaticum TaxID=387340 RepID=UPI00122D3E24|nr:hypothetical protein [Halorubrum aquaticum]
MYVPDDRPETCPACGDPYESASRHAGGFAVNLRDNERYRRVCFHPTTTAEGEPALDCFHHTHAQATGDGVESSDDAPDSPVPAERS